MLMDKQLQCLHAGYQLVHDFDARTLRTDDLLQVARNGYFSVEEAQVFDPQAITSLPILFPFNGVIDAVRLEEALGAELAKPIKVDAFEQVLLNNYLVDVGNECLRLQIEALQRV